MGLSGQVGPLILIKNGVVLPGFEPGSTAPKAAMIGHYTIGLLASIGPGLC